MARGKRGALLIILISLILLDRISKLFFNTKIRNTGTLFGLFNGNNLLFIFLSIFFIVILIFAFLKVSYLQKVSLIFIIAGIGANLIDRILFGYVADFIDIIIFPVFNLADVFIVVGIILTLTFMVKPNKRKSK